MNNAKKSKESEVMETLANIRKETGESISEFKFNMKRVRKLTKASGNSSSGGVVYWMNRDMRVQDNWAMLYAQKMALKANGPLHVLVCVPPRFLEMTHRHYNFMMEGLKEVAEECKSLNINFHISADKPQECFNSTFLEKLDIDLIVTDFSPLREHQEALEEVKKIVPDDVSLHEVDAHNVVPCWVASEKQEYAARTIRPKITNRLPEFLTQFPPVIEHPVSAKVGTEAPQWDLVEKVLEIDREGWGVEPVDWAVPGTKSGLDRVHKFVTRCLKIYATKRNDPIVEALSHLSPWVNFGQISMQRAVLHAKQFGKSYSDAVATFVEEAIIRRELSDNFCYYNDNYDRLEGASDWAQKTLEDHVDDKRDYVYSKEQWAEAKTHDDLWNSAQLQLVKEGKMHGFMRMYWAKKILEWSATPKEALATSIYLNDRFSLDGNNPNGFVGCMWSVCGIHDQGWGERPVFGKIRFMNYAGCKRKFDINAYIARYGGKVYSSKSGQKKDGSQNSASQKQTDSLNEQGKGLRMKLTQERAEELKEQLKKIIKHGETDNKAMDVLRSIESLKAINQEILMKTQIGFVINDLRKTSQNTEVNRYSKDILKKWKKIVS